MSIDKSRKIAGFDKWEVEDAARTLMNAEKIKAGNPKFLKVVQGECDRIAAAAEKAALEKKTQAKLVKVFKRGDT